MEHLQTIQKVFADKLLRVPDYQRGYAWDKRQLQDLIEDLEVLKKNKEHYTGTLVLHLDETREQIIDQEGNMLHIYDVVDGQQRLTTLIILLHCISKELKSNFNKKIFADGIRKNYIKIIDMENQEKARLTLNKECHEFFVKNIISEKPTVGGPEIKSHERLNQALNYFWDHLQEIKRDKPQKFESWLRDLHKKIINGLKLTVYQVPNESDVGVIFEVMNNRGKPLSEMEKVKNYLLYLASKIEMKAASKLSKQINSVWASIFQRLMESGVSTMEFENQLLRSSWLMAYSYFAKDWGGYSSVKERFNLKKYSNKEEKLLKDLTSYVEILRQSCIAYCDIMAPYHDESYKRFHDQPEIRKRLQRKTGKLSRIGNRVPFLPLLMAARIKFPDNHDFHEELLDICERYAFRIYRVERSRSNTGQSNLFKQGYNLFKGHVSPKFVLRNIKRSLLYYSPEENFNNFFHPGMDWYNFHGLKYFLYEYEENLSRGKGVLLPWDKLVSKDKKDSIEHILPQTWNRSYWKEKWKKDDIDLFLHDIGNLTLTFDNSVYSNKPFPEKKGRPGEPNCYATSNFFQEKELALYSMWTVNVLKKRRKKIIDWAIERWTVKGDDLEEIELEEEEYDEIELKTESDLTDLEEEEDEIQEDDSKRKQPIKRWSDEEIFEYLDNLKMWGQITYYYFKVLASIEGKIGYNKLIKRIKSESGKDFHERSFAGVLSALTKRASQKGGERLDRISEEGWAFALNKKYRDRIKKYFEQAE